jgi:hypothetical protein
MLKMILMLLFSIKIAIVSSVCLKTACQDVGQTISDPDSPYTLGVETGQRLEKGGALAFLLSVNKPTFSECGSKCLQDYRCAGMDYNCKTGACVLFTYDFNSVNFEFLKVVDVDHIIALPL